MSYCRWGWDGSDVYVYASDAGIMCACDSSEKYRITEPPNIVDEPEEMIAHLAAHRRAGHFIPFYAIKGLWEDIPGPNEPVEPEPEEFTRLKEQRNEAHLDALCRAVRALLTEDV